MASPTARTIDRRDAAVTAGLAGAVLVIVGYASGIGLRPAAEVAATLPEQPATSTPSASEPTAPLVPPIAAEMPASMPAAMPVLPVPSTTNPVASHTPAPSPRPTPTPTPTASSCPKGLVATLVGGLPLVGEVTSLVTDLLSAPLVGSADVSESPAATTDPLDCAVGSVLGTTCCVTESTAALVTGAAR
jgi:hypothetical protein